MTLTFVKPFESTRSSTHPPDFHWTAEEFYRAASAGEFEDPNRLELVQGRLRRLMQGERHANVRARLSRRLRIAIDPPLFVRDENPLHIASDMELIPDLMATYQEEYPGRHPLPGDAALLVEVADSSSEYVLGEKALLYAQAGIADLWVVMVNDGMIVQNREPTPDGYESILRLSGEDTISPLALPKVSLSVNALLSRSETTGV